jgi:hypothetical protein
MRRKAIGSFASTLPAACDPSGILHCNINIGRDSKQCISSIWHHPLLRCRRKHNNSYYYLSSLLLLHHPWDDGQKIIESAPPVAQQR